MRIRGGARCSDACTLETPWTSRSVRPYVQPHLPAQRTPHCARQAPKPTMVCGGGGGAPAVAGNGAVKGLAHSAVRTYASTRGHPAMCRACITEGPFTPPSPPTPGVRLTHFLIDPTPRMRTIDLLPTPQPFPLRLSSSASLSLCLPLYLPLIHLALTRVQNICLSTH